MHTIRFSTVRWLPPWADAVLRPYRRIPGVRIIDVTYEKGEFVLTVTALVRPSPDGPWVERVFYA